MNDKQIKTIETGLKDKYDIIQKALEAEEKIERRIRQVNKSYENRS